MDVRCANYFKRESIANKKWSPVRLSLEHRNLPLLAPSSTDWASGPFDTNVLKVTFLKQRVYASNLKRESNPNKKWDIVRKSLEHRTVFISTTLYRLSKRTIQSNIEQIDIFMQWMYANYLKRETDPKKKVKSGPCGSRTDDLIVVSTTLYRLSKWRISCKRTTN